MLKKRINKNPDLPIGGAKQKNSKKLLLTIFIFLSLFIIIPTVSAKQANISPILHINTELDGVDLTQVQVNDITNNDTSNVGVGKGV